MKKILSLVIVLFISNCSMNKTHIPPIENFNVNKILGKWHEIARLDHDFEKGCTDVFAFYSRRLDGGLNVLNRCMVENEEKIANGRAYFKESEKIGSLKVSFFRPFYGDYNIIYADKNYQYMMVDGGTYDYFWILSRDARMEPAKLQMLIRKAKELGFNTDELIFDERNIIK